MDDLQARLDRAITEARKQPLWCNWGHERGVNDDTPAARRCDGCRNLDHYASLVALRARLDEHEVIPCDNKNCPGWLKLERDAERLLGEGA